MAIPLKACIFGGLGCVTAIGIALSQAESSLSVREKLAFEGYVLIWEKETIEAEIWQARAKLYKESHSKLSLNGLDHQNIETNPNKLKEECEKYTSKGVSINSLGEGVYEKLTTLCTLTIKEYIKSHLNKETEKLIDQEDSGDWKEIYGKHEKEINKFKEIATKDNPKEEVKKICEELFALQKSNKEKDKEYQASQWCIDKKEQVADKAEEEDSDSDSD